MANVNLFGEADQEIKKMASPRGGRGDPKPTKAEASSVEVLELLPTDVIQADGVKATVSPTDKAADLEAKKSSGGKNQVDVSVSEYGQGRIDRATISATFTVPFGSLSVADDNPWGSDVVEDEPFRRVLAAAPTPLDLDPMFVVRDGNGWKIIGDPAALIAIARTHEGHPTLASCEIPVREVTGSKASIVFHVANQALGGRAFKNMRRARLALNICETEGLNGKVIAAQLGLHSSGTTRDLKAARMEREHPMLAGILKSPSDAPVSYYTHLREYADMQSSPDKAMAAIVATAGKLAKAGKTFTAVDAKVALGVKTAAVRKAFVAPSTQLKVPSHLSKAVVTRTASGTTIMTLEFPKTGIGEAQRLAALETWIAASNPFEGKTA